MSADRRGAALLEVLVALAILGAAGTAIVSAVSAAARAEHDLAVRERSLQAANRVLTAMTLLTRADLDRRLGRREVGEFVVLVGRPEATLYRIAIAERASPDVEALVTVVYRPEPAMP